MTIIKTNIDTTDKRQIYRMTKGESNKIDGLERGLSLPVDLWCLYVEEKERKKQDGGTEMIQENVLTFTSGPHKFGTISATFIRSFLEIVEIMEDDPFAILITGGETKSGRHYVNCEMDCDFQPPAV